MTLVTVGRVGKPHGIDGSFFVDGGSASAERFALGATLLVDGAAAEIVGSKRAAGGRFVIKLDRDAPRGATLAVRREELPEPGEDTYYVFQLVGLAVEEEGGRPLGVVAEVENLPANDVLGARLGRSAAPRRRVRARGRSGGGPCADRTGLRRRRANLSRPCASTSSPRFRTRSPG